MRRYVLLFVLMASLVYGSLANAEPIHKKLIDAGSRITPQRLRQDLKLMDDGFLDGTVISIKASGMGNGLGDDLFGDAFSNQPWNREWFAKAVSDLQAIHPKKLTDNFAGFNAQPGSVDWFDDAGWKVIVDHWRIAAWVAKQGRLKGVLFDAEPYRLPYRQFSYSAQANKDKYTFTEYYNKARQRGREVMKAVSGEYPDITILTYFLLSYPVYDDSGQGPSPVGMHDRMPALSVASYGLLVGFIDGWLDVMPPTVKVVDGCERGYEFDKESDFFRAAVKMRVDAQELISTENRAKYRAQFQASFGIYMDANVFATKDYPLDCGGLSRSALLERDVRAALFAADEYVWLWSEQGTFWPDSGNAASCHRHSRKLWDVLMPGCDEALRAATDPVGYEVGQAKKLVAEGRAIDIVQNGNFDPSAAHVRPSFALKDWETEHSPAYWSLYPAGLPLSSIGFDGSVGFGSPGSVRIAGVQEAIAIQTYTVSPGQSYLVEAAVRSTGSMVPSVRIEWMDSENAWLSNAKAKYYVVDILPEGKEGTWIKLAR